MGIFLRANYGFEWVPPQNINTFRVRQDFMIHFTSIILWIGSRSTLEWWVYSLHSNVSSYNKVCAAAFFSFGFLSRFVLNRFVSCRTLSQTLSPIRYSVTSYVLQHPGAHISISIFFFFPLSPKASPQMLTVVWQGSTGILETGLISNRPWDKWLTCALLCRDLIWTFPCTWLDEHPCTGSSLIFTFSLQTRKLTAAVLE